MSLGLLPVTRQPPPGVAKEFIALLGPELAVPDHPNPSRGAETLAVICPRPGRASAHPVGDSAALMLEQNTLQAAPFLDVWVTRHARGVTTTTGLPGASGTGAVR